MSITALFVALLSADGGQAVSVVATAPQPAEARRSADQPDTRRVCRFERATGSNLQQRVCRDIPRQGVQDQQTREFMRAVQRIRTPDDGAAPSPGG